MFKYLNYFISNSQHINFNNPFNGQKWLSLLDVHDDFGLLFKKNINISKDWLGFSFSSNEHGLRGPGNEFAPNVILGTSFGMGLSVDNGRNWYDYIKDKETWFNSSMPVGPSNHKKVIDELYKGEKKKLIYLYHPNTWVIAKSYMESAKLSIAINEYLGWKTKKWEVIFLYIKWILKELTKLLLGHSIFKQKYNDYYYLNTRYSYLPIEKNS